MKPARIVAAHQKRLDYLTNFIAQTDEREYANRVMFARGEAAATRATLAMWERVRNVRALMMADGVQSNVTDAINKAAESVEISDMADFKLRGMLAAKLECWHRLTESEAKQLVNLVAFINGDFE